MDYRARAGGAKNTGDTGLGPHSFSRTVEIIKLPVEEWKAYRDLRLRALQEDPQAFGSIYAEQAQFPQDRWTSRLRDAESEGRSWLFFARENRKLVGMIGAFVEDSDPHTAAIVSVYVPLEERGKGISSELMEFILRELSRHPSFQTAALSVRTTQVPAIRLYEKFGFQQVRVEPVQASDGSPAEEIVMERPLPYPP